MNMPSGLGSCAKSKLMVPTTCATYSISKAALNKLSVHQAHDYGADSKGAVVICMDPGWVKTRMGGEGAVLTPAESIGGMLKTLHGVGEADAGKCFAYSGEGVPW
ncbi:MAG: short chain dehydrogenase reductase SDR [Lasallia pustulata]|uniref:Short chain dehydrogenase reductase SDR n=1 Tax=Lasallia pustulata TaxID=136370 RepID=A0A5M8Q3Y6_9LECA|nr:MAG: short chain dehydrogenase reductase SDR [Lasallia pustulata]